jgi:hypothetical protein
LLCCINKAGQGAKEGTLLESLPVLLLLLLLLLLLCSTQLLLLLLQLWACVGLDSGVVIARHR